MSDQLTTDFKNFQEWYVKPLRLLYEFPEAGFPILIITFPLLERYIRNKCGIDVKSNLDDSFFMELTGLFPELNDSADTAGQQGAKEFWKVFRHGLLHRVTMSRQDRKNASLPVGWLSYEKEKCIWYDNKNDVWVHPVEFSKRVISSIEENFVIFGGSQSDLPKVDYGEGEECYYGEGVEYRTITQVPPILGTRGKL